MFDRAYQLAAQLLARLDRIIELLEKLERRERVK
jgi:hypothetical protein